MSGVKNSYPELPEVAYKRTVIGMPYVVAYGKTLIGKYSLDAIRMAYAIFRNESANGLKGVNNNYAGIQADNDRWTNLPGIPTATCIKKDSGNVYRRYLCFDENGYKISFELTCIKATERNMITADDYYKKWVRRVPNETELKNFKSLLKAGEKVFTNNLK